MKFLLDTATWVNAVTLPQSLPAGIRDLIRSEPHGIASVSLLEVAILHRLGRLEWTATLRDFFTVAVSPRLAVFELTPAIAELTNGLPAGFPGDSFDRTIAATARALDLELVTPDPKIKEAGFCRVRFYPFRRR